MIILALLVYGAFFQGLSVPVISFIGAAIFDIALAEAIFK